MEKENLKQFIFYDLFWFVIKAEDDETAGRMIKNICTFMFTGNALFPFVDDNESFDWSSIEKELETVKEFALKGKVVKTYNKKMKHFTFYDNYYKAIKMLNDKDSGIYVKALCSYMLDGKEVKKLKSPVCKYYDIAKRKLELSKVRKTSGSVGGKKKKEVSPPVPITIEKIKTDFNIMGNLREENPVLDDVDLNKLYDFIKDNPDMRELSFYRIVMEYRNAFGLPITG